MTTREGASAKPKRQYHRRWLCRIEKIFLISWLKSAIDLILFCFVFMSNSSG